MKLIPPPGPVRTLAIGGLIRTTGYGLMVTITVLYFVRSVELSAARVGLGMTIAAACAMVASVLAGRAADVAGARNTAILLVLVQGVAVSCYAIAGGFVAFVIAVSVVISCHASAESARGALMAALLPPEERVTARAYLHSVTNVGISLGAITGGVALHFDSRPVYVAMLLACGVLFAASGLVYLALPAVAAAARSAPSGKPRWEVLRDRPFAAFALVNALLMMNDSLLTVVLPIWIAQQTDAPVVVYSAILILNTVLVVFLQVRASRGASDAAGGAVALRRSGVLLAVGCALYAVASGQSAWVAVVILLAGAAVHTFGELLYSVGSWSLAFELAPEHAQGQYQGVFNMSIQLAGMITPLVATALIFSIGWPGWIVFAAILLAAGLIAPPIVAWAARTRPLRTTPTPAT